MSDGLLDVDERVATVIPEFGANGKEAVTYRQVLTHTGGFPMAPIRYPAMRDRAHATRRRWPGGGSRSNREPRWSTTSRRRRG